MGVKKTFEEINEKIKKGKVVVVTAEEMSEIVKKEGVKEATKKVDVVTTGTFGPMCSSGAFFNFGHAEPPTKIAQAWINDVPVFGGLAAVDVYVGATERSLERGEEYGGAHIIEDFVRGKSLKLKALSPFPTDCYPGKEIETYFSKETVNEAYLYNPRNCYQNYAAATNSSEKAIYTYMGILLPRYGNVTYCTSSQLSPLLNDPYYRTIGVGTRIFLGGAVGYVAWMGTQHNPTKERNKKGIPLGPAGTLALIGDLKKMNHRYLRACTFTNYGVSLFVGVGVPIPILDEEMAVFTGVSDEDIETVILDYSVPSRSRPVVKKVNYAELRQGKIEIEGKKVLTSPITSYIRSREIANNLKEWIKEGKFLLTEPVAPLPQDTVFKPLQTLKGEEA
jgi:uncharacterized protein (DUF39 family)